MYVCVVVVVVMCPDCGRGYTCEDDAIAVVTWSL